MPNGISPVIPPIPYHHPHIDYFRAVPRDYIMWLLLFLTYMANYFPKGPFSENIISKPLPY